MPEWVIAVIGIGSALLWVLVAKIQWEVWRVRCQKVGCRFGHRECVHVVGAGFGVLLWPAIFPVLLIVMGVDAFVNRQSGSQRSHRPTRQQKRLAKIAERQKIVDAKLKLAQTERELSTFPTYPIANEKSLR